MPIYEFECDKCHRRIEMILPTMKDAEPIDTPTCGCGGKTKQVISKTSFRLVPGGSGGFHKPSKL